MRVEAKVVNSAFIFSELESKLSKMFVKKISFTKKRSCAAKQGKRNLARVPTKESSIQHRDAMSIPNVEILGRSYRSYLNHHAPNMEKRSDQQVMSEVELPLNNRDIISEGELPKNNHTFMAEVELPTNNPKSFSDVHLSENNVGCMYKVELPTNNQQVHLEDVSERKCYGGMRSAFDGSKKQCEKIDYEGIRVTNSGHDCYINAATNIIIANPTIMTEIQKVTEDLEPAGGKSVLREVQRLASQRQVVQNVRALKGKLFQMYPKRVSYGNENQEDAGQPLFDIINCLPGLIEKFTLMIRTVHKCLDCGIEDMRMDVRTSISFQEFSLRGVELQDNIDAWCQSSYSLEKGASVKCSYSVLSIMDVK